MQSENLPVVEPQAQMSAVIVAMTESRTGLALVMDNDKLKGIVTDGDLRRYLLEHQSLEGVYAKDIMTADPVCTQETTMLVDAENLMKEKHIKWLVAQDKEERVTGLLEWSA